MWYFSWVLGLGFACCFAILNAMLHESRKAPRKATGNTEALLSKSLPSKNS